MAGHLLLDLVRDLDPMAVLDSKCQRNKELFAAITQQMVSNTTEKVRSKWKTLKGTFKEMRTKAVKSG